MNVNLVLHKDTFLAKRSPSLLSANGLYLLSMLLVIAAGSALQFWSLSWGLLITEIGLILLPTLWLLRREGLDVRETLQLRWPGAWTLVLAVAIGAGVWPLAVILEGVSAALLGYAPPSPFASMPTDPLNLAVFAIALAVAAPVCEEVLFRGYLLSAYGRYKPLLSLLAVSLLFVFFHLRLQGLLALVPIALTLGYLAQRSRSLVPAIIAHSANNALSASLFIATTLQPKLTADPTWQITLGGVTLIGPVLALAALWWFRRITPPLPIIDAPPSLQRQAWWPLAGAALIYLAFAGFELIIGRFPHWLAEPTLHLEPAPWAQPLTLKYDLRNVLDEIVGEAECTFTPQGEHVNFDCVTRQRNFEARLGNSFFAGGEYELRQTGQWQMSTMQLREAHFQFQGEYDSWEAAISPMANGLSLTVGETSSQSIPADSVVAAEWPWRMMALPFERFPYWGSGFTLIKLKPGEGSGQSEATAALIYGTERLPTPTGPISTWKVTRGRETAWYSIHSPHVLFKYSDGFGVTWLLRSTSASSSRGEIKP